MSKNNPGKNSENHHRLNKQTSRETKPPRWSRISHCPDSQICAMGHQRLCPGARLRDVFKGGWLCFFSPSRVERLVGGRLRGGLLVVVEDISLKRGFRRCFIITEERQIVRRPPKTNHPPGKPTYPSKKTQRGKKEELSFSPGMIC